MVKRNDNDGGEREVREWLANAPAMMAAAANLMDTMEDVNYGHICMLWAVAMGLMPAEAARHQVILSMLQLNYGRPDPKWQVKMAEDLVNSKVPFDRRRLLAWLEENR